MHMITDKIKTRDHLCTIIKRHKSQNQRVGLLCGCFDIPHIGHIRLFEFAKSTCDILAIGLDHDTAIRLTKGENRPVHTQIMRMEMIAAISFVDYVFPLTFKKKFGCGNSYRFWHDTLSTLKPDALFTTPKADRFAKSKKAIAESLNIEFHAYTELHDISSTAIEKIFIGGY